jgi:hypothetical protein
LLTLSASAVSKPGAIEAVVRTHPAASRSRQFTRPSSLQWHNRSAPFLRLRESDKTLTKLNFSEIGRNAGAALSFVGLLENADEEFWLA